MHTLIYTFIYTYFIHKHSTYIYIYKNLHIHIDSYTCIHSHFSLHAHITYISHNSQSNITHIHTKAPSFTYTHLYKYIDPHSSHMHTVTHNALALPHVHTHTQ